MVKHLRNTSLQVVTLLAICFAVGVALTGQADGQIVTVLKGENCSDGPVTLNACLPGSPKCPE